MVLTDTERVTVSLERRWDRVWHALFVAALAAPTGALLLERGSEPPALTTAGLALAFALWHALLWARRLRSRSAVTLWWAVAVNVYAKLGVDDRTAAVVAALDRGLLDLGGE